ncbi:hypothetical protein NCAS_0I01950 [Naumovozyma castellii]|uniref:RecA family profile 1 domain-containing protein n=1 Tax=Naumovozyma castellii TaxID=27288 RepID=G0VK29_NAUCA|nr:hypothetical protein NCAS_0I01950 [Naumovozyma castellii CBS 4309]CCC71863.1 hypothetical protein NCAS_0I01950 [Naumovozyma castellii CBS 4309]
MDLYDELPQSELLYDPAFTLLLESCEQHQLSVVDFITLNARELSRISQRSITDVYKFQQLLLRELHLQYVNENQPHLLERGSEPKHFTTGDLAIDDILGGGIFTKNITEIFGESSTGKSQFLMQLSLSVQLPLKMGGLGGKCVYITTEGDLPTQRIEGILSSRSEFTESGVSQDNIFTVSCNDLESQEHILNVQLPVLLERNNSAIKLVIIDSISHHMRVELQGGSVKEAQNNRSYVDQTAERLLDLANKFSVAIVVANQVGDKPLQEVINPYQQSILDYEYQLGWLVGWKDSSIMYRQKQSELINNDDILSDDEDSILIESQFQKFLESREPAQPNQGTTESNKPSNTSVNSNQNAKSRSTLTIQKIRKRNIDQRIPNLGLSWANHVSTRILLKKTYKASPLIQRGEIKFYEGSDVAKFWKVKRILKVVFSTFCSSDEITFEIIKRGIEAIT